MDISHLLEDCGLARGTRAEQEKLDLALESLLLLQCERGSSPLLPPAPEQAGAHLAELLVDLARLGGPGAGVLRFGDADAAEGGAHGVGVGGGWVGRCGGRCGGEGVWVRRVWVRGAGRGEGTKGSRR